jgi:hypothetical protein
METPENQPVVQQPTPSPTRKSKQPRTYRVSWPVVFIVSLLVFVGLGVWQYGRVNKLTSQLSAKEELLQTSKTEIAKLTTARDQALSALVQSTASNDYMLIGEWGVKFRPGPDDLADLFYLTNGDSVQPSTRSLMQAALAKKGAATNNAYDAICSPAALPLGVMQRGKAGAAFQGTTYDKIAGAIKAGDYYYIIVSPQAPCSADKSVQDLQTKQTAALKEAIKTLVPSSE